MVPPHGWRLHGRLRLVEGAFRRHRPVSRPRAWGRRAETILQNLQN
jgi:hypothetical protein